MVDPAPPPAPTYPVRHQVTFHSTAGDRVVILEEYAPDEYRTVAESPVGPQGPTAGQIVHDAGFRSDGRPIPGGGEEVNMPSDAPAYPVDASGPSQSQQAGFDANPIKPP